MVNFPQIYGEISASPIVKSYLSPFLRIYYPILKLFNLLGEQNIIENRIYLENIITLIYSITTLIPVYTTIELEQLYNESRKKTEETEETKEEKKGNFRKA